MEQNKPSAIAVSAVKPASPAGVAAVRPITPSSSISSQSSAPKPFAAPAKKAAKPAAKKAKPAIKKAKPAAKKPAIKKAAPAAKKPAAKKAAPAAKKPAASSKGFWSAGSAASSPFAASAKTAKQPADQFLKMGTDMMTNFFGADSMKGVFAPLGGEAQKISEKAFGFGKDGAAQLSKSADAAARSLNDAVSISQDNMEACVECGNIAAELSKAVGEEVFEFSNDLFSKNVELSKQIFACRTINDMFELQSKAFKMNIDKVFGETAKISEMTFKMASKASAPLNERAAQVTKHIKKTLSA